MEMDGSVYRRSGRKSDFEGDTAIVTAALFGVFRAQRLRCGDAARPQVCGLHAGAPEHIEDMIGALPAEREIGSFDAGTVRVADYFNRDCSTELLGLDEEALDILFALREGRFLTGLELGAS